MQPFVFLPGTLCDERLWRHQTAEFRPHHVANLRTQESLDEMLDAVAAAPFKTFVLVGFSMGGYVAQEFALRYPDRVSNLVVVGTSCEGYPADEAKIVRAALPSIERGLFRGLTDKRIQGLLHPRAYPKHRDLLLSMAGPDAAEVYRRQIKATLDRRDLSREIGRLRCPIVAVAGREDQLVSASSILRIEEHAPQAEIFVLPECGHFIPLEQPDRLNEILARIYTAP